MRILDFLQENVLELFFALVIARGASWAEIILGRDDWVVHRTEPVLDFVFICLSWAVTPMVFIGAYLHRSLPSGCAVVILVLIAQICAITFLLKKRRTEFFVCSRTIRVPLRYIPVLLLGAKLYLSWKYN